MTLNLGQQTQLPPTVILGEDKVLNVQVNQITQDNCGNDCTQPLDISAATQIVAIFQNADLSFLYKKLSLSQIAITSGPFGRFSITLLAADTALLAPSPGPQPGCCGGGYSAIEIHLTIAGQETIINLPNSVNIVPRQFPTSTNP